MGKAAGISLHMAHSDPNEGIPSRGDSMHQGLVAGNLGFLPTGGDGCLGGGLAGEAKPKE